MSQLLALKPNLAAEKLKAGRAVLIDIRDPDEFARRHIEGARSRPLSSLKASPLAVAPDREVIFTCRSGMRTAANAVERRAPTRGAP